MTPRVFARLCCAALAAGLGTATLLELARVPDGIARGNPVVLLRELFLGTGFRTSLALCTLVAALLLMLAVRLMASTCRLSHPQALRILEPLAWGAALPVVAWLLDPWWFWSTAPPLAAAGVGLGMISCHLRFRDATEDLPHSRLGDRAHILGFVAIAILLPTLMVSAGPPWWPSISGDEPHYLLTARSIWVDHDINLANDYAERQHWDFYPAKLARHAKAGVAPDTLYSIHSVGLSLWLTPWFGVGQALSRSAFTLLVRFSMTLWLGAFAAILFLLLRDMAGSRAAVRGTLLAILTAPLLFASPHLFPEVPALTLSAAAYLILRRAPGVMGALFAGIALAFLPWLHFKYFALMATVAAAGVWFITRGSDHEWGGSDDEGTARRSRYLAIVALAAPLLTTGIVHVLFTWQLYGRFSPLAISVGSGAVARASAFGDNYLAYIRDPWGALRTGIGFFLDQKEGLLFYAPHYLLAITGLAWLWRQRRADSVTLILCLLSLWGPYALSQEIGHWAPPSRPLTGVLWTLALPMGIGATLAAGSGWTGKARSALRGVLIAWGIGMTLLLLPQSELLYHDHNIARSLVLLRYGAPGLSLSSLAPLWFYYQQAQWAASFSWLAAGALTAVVLWRWGRAEADLETTERISAGHSAARVFVIIAATAFLLHHLLVPVSGLHIRHDNGPVRVWVPNIPQGRAWHSALGTWVGGDDSVELLLSSRDPLNFVTVEVQAMSGMSPEVQIGQDRQKVGLDAGEQTLLRFSPGPGRAWRRGYFYHFRVVAPGGTSPAALGGNRRDLRTLGLLVRVLEAQ